MKQIRARVEVLSAEEIRAIHDSSLRILERIGVRVPHEDCLARCQRAGAVVEETSGIVRIPSGLMAEVLSHFQDEERKRPQESQPARTASTREP